MQSQITVEFTLRISEKVQKVEVTFINDGSNVYMQARAALMNKLGHKDFRVMDWKVKG